MTECRRSWSRYAVWLAPGLVLPSAALAQAFKPTEYHAYLPPPGKPAEQTAASRKFQLFRGNNGPDASGTPGVSRQREERLRAIAARFSPILVPTNFSVPRDFEDVLAFSYDSATHSVHCRRGFELVVDVWKTALASAEPDPGLSTRVPLRTIRSPTCPPRDSLPPPNTSPDTIYRGADSLLRELLLRLGPKPAHQKGERNALKPTTEGDSTELRYTPDRRVRQNADTVLYFDMPGSERATWRDAYIQLRYLRSRIYMHPFVHEHEGAMSAARYEIVLQYWFFYPLNDGVNNHEGDWEHLNVSISTRNRLENLTGESRLLTGEEVQGILDAPGSSGLDSLAISAVDYYFHNFVATVDYKEAHEHDGVTGTPLYGREIAERFGVVRVGIPEEENRFYNDVLARLVHDRMNNGPELLRTHPVSFIGGMSVSPTQILTLPGPGNANSHGSYPFTGVWRGVGPFVAREKMRGDFDASKAARLSSIPPGRDTLDLVHYIDPCYQPGAERPCLQGDSAPIVLLPDWEEMVDLLYSDTTAAGATRRRNWAWFALPIRWGYPITGSPGARLVRGYDFGNAAPVGPAFNAAWNRVGSGPGYVRYPLYPLTRGLQQTPWDNIYNVLGFGNVVPTVATLLPPVSVVATVFTGLVHGRRRVFAPVRPGMRNVDVGYAVSWGFGGTGFARRLPHLGQFAGLAPDAPGSDDEREDFIRDPDVGHHAELLLHWGRRWGTETIYSWRTSDLSYHGHLESGSFADVRGRLDKKELLGVFRLGTLVPLGFRGQFVLRFGYGWSWYTIDGIHLEAVGGPPFAGTTTTSVRDGPHIFPNTILGGVAFESTFRLFRRPRSTFGGRVAWTAYSTKDAGGRTDLTAGLMAGF